MEYMRLFFGSGEGMIIDEAGEALAA